MFRKRINPKTLLPKLPVRNDRHSLPTPLLDRMPCECYVLPKLQWLVDGAFRLC